MYDVNKDITVYPNPAANTMGISIQSKGNYHAYLYDVMGRLAKTTSVVAAGQQLVNIDVQDLSTGNYVLHVHTDGTVATHKVVIAR
jgi:hypothetical protein